MHFMKFVILIALLTCASLSTEARPQRRFSKASTTNFDNAILDELETLANDESLVTPLGSEVVLAQPSFFGLDQRRRFGSTALMPGLFPYYRSNAVRKYDYFGPRPVY